MSAPPSGTVPSPCINVCRMDTATGWCEGCQRTLHEIAAWSGLSDADKRAVWHTLAARRELWLRLHPELRAEPPLPVAPRHPKGDTA